MNSRPASATGIDAHQYLAKDLKRAIAFYRDVIGLQPSSGSQWDHGTEFQLGDGSTFGVFAMPDGSWYPGNAGLPPRLVPRPRREQLRDSPAKRLGRIPDSIFHCKGRVANGARHSRSPTLRTQTYV